jgi:hypothetical protein
LASRLVNALVTKGGFGLPSRDGENGFIPARFCFVGGAPVKQKAVSL